MAQRRPGCRPHGHECVELGLSTGLRGFTGQTLQASGHTQARQINDLVADGHTCAKRLG